MTLAAMQDGIAGRLFKNAWAKGRHCIVPLEAFYEPDWHTGKHVPTRFSAADGETLGIAGLWQPWKSPEGQWINSFCTLTINADDHEMFYSMHRPDPRRPADKEYMQHRAAESSVRSLSCHHLSLQHPLDT